MQYSLTLLQRIQQRRNNPGMPIIEKVKNKRIKPLKIDKEILLPMKDTINWHCSCGLGFHHYFVNCSECGKENPLDGKLNLLKK